MRVVLLFICLSFFACQTPSELESLNGCGADIPKNAIVKTDFNKNFKIKIPENWSTSYYYTPSTSEMYSADTTKQLTNSYIMELIHHDANLILGPDLHEKITAFNKANHYSLVDLNELSFKGKPASFFTLKGRKNNNDVLIFDLYIKISERSYLNSKTEVYGNQNIQQRLCESLAIINTLEFIK